MRYTKAKQRCRQRQRDINKGYAKMQPNTMRYIQRLNKDVNKGVDKDNEI